MPKGSLKLISLILALLFILSVAVGCGSKSTDTTDKTTNNGETSNKGEEQGKEEEQVVEETYDFGGRVIREAAWWDLEPQPGTSEGADKQIARRDELMEKYNFTVEYLNVPYDQYLETFTASTLSGEPFADLCEVPQNWFYPGLVANGFLKDWDSLGIDLTKEKWEPTTLEFGLYQGKHYAMMAGTFFPRSGVFFNKTLFDREGIPYIYDMVYDKTWTWDKMLEIAKKTTKDLDGDGIIDQWGIEDMNLEWQLIASNGGSPIKTVDGKAVFGLLDPEALEALQFFQDLHNLHKVVEPTDGQAWDYPGQQFQDGKAAFLAYEWWFVDRLYPNMADDYGWVPFPMGPRMNEYVSDSQGHNVKVIPATVVRPEEVALYYDWMTEPYPDEDEDSWREYPESKSRDEETVQMFRNWHLWNLSKINVWGSFPDLVNLGYSFMWQIESGNKTPQVAIEEIAAQAQAILDDAFVK